MSMFNKGRWKIWAGSAAMLFLTGVVTKSVLAGPQTLPNAKDIQKATVEMPAKGHDERGEIPRGNFVAGNGIVEPADRETKVSSQVGGRIERVLVVEGAMVEAGAPLVELEHGSEKAAVEAADADLGVARADLTRTLRGLRQEDVEAIVADSQALRARAEQSENNRMRIVKLATTGAATPDDLDKAEKQAEADKRSLESAEAKRRAAIAGSRSEDILAAQARVAGAVARRDQAKAQLDRLTIRAPIAGEILQMKFRAGEYYAPTAGEIAIMGDTSKLRVRTDVDERDIAKLKLGAHAFATVNAFPGRKFGGKVVELGRRMGRKNVRTDDPTERIDTKILEVVIELDEKSGLVPGLRVTSFIDAST